MFNLMRMEMRRMFKQKSTYFILLTTIAALTIYAVLLHFTIQSVEQHENNPPSATQTEDTEGGAVEIQLESSELFDGSGEDLLLGQYSGQGLLMFTIIFGALFFTSPYRNGFVKNFLGLRKRRSGFVLTQFGCGILYTLLVFLVGTAVLLATQNLFFSERFPINDLPGMFRLIGWQLVPHISFLALILLLATWTRSTSATLVTGLLYSLIFYKPLFNLLTIAIEKIFHTGDDWTLRNYTVLGSMEAIDWGVSDSDLIRALVVSVIFMVLAVAGSCLVIQKKDI
jgi:ABC-type transport system involved in multi-copper enzyme maturation permease subunit